MVIAPPSNLDAPASVGEDTRDSPPLVLLARLGDRADPGWETMGVALASIARAIVADTERRVIARLAEADALVLPLDACPGGVESLVVRIRALRPALPVALRVPVRGEIGFAVTRAVAAGATALLPGAGHDLARAVRAFCRMSTA